MSDAKKQSSIPGETPISSKSLNRRQMVGRILASGTGGFLLPRAAASLPLHQPAKGSGSPPTAKQSAEAVPWKPEFLDPHQDETFLVLAEQILPGATQAGVNRIVDSLLSVDTQENQEKFLNALSAMDAESQKRFGHPFQTLSGEQQHEILRYASTSGRGQPEADTDWSWFMLPQKPSSNPPRLRDHFELLKMWVAKTYLATETGMKDLGWTGNYYFPTFPGCKPSSENR